MEVDSFRYLSPLIKRYYQLSQVKKEIPIPLPPCASRCASAVLH